MLLHVYIYIYVYIYTHSIIPANTTIQMAISRAATVWKNGNIAYVMVRKRFLNKVETIAILVKNVRPTSRQASLASSSQQ